MNTAEYTLHSFATYSLRVLSIFSHTMLLLKNTAEYTVHPVATSS